MKVEDAIARATTPAPMSQEDQDLREQVIFKPLLVKPLYQLRRMIQRGQYNEAFTKALMASDLPVVIDLLEMVDQSKILRPKSNLNSFRCGTVSPKKKVHSPGQQKSG